MNSRFSAGLSKLKETGGKADRPAAAPAAAVATSAAETPSRWRQKGREGKVVISGYFDEAVRKQLKLMAVHQSRDQIDLLAEALNLLFEKHGESPIAKA